MEWVTVLGFILTGGIGKAVADQMIKGWRQRSRARGNHESLVDALRRSRLWWMERTYQARRLVIETGGEVPPISEDEDPYLVWESRNNPDFQDLPG